MNGGGGIRTHEARITRLAVFKTAPFSHSGTPPCVHHGVIGLPRATRAVILVAISVAMLGACGGGSESVAPTGSTASVAVASQAAGSRTRQTAELPDGTAIDYTLVLPNAYEPGKSYPVLLVLPPGGQGQAEVDFVLDAYWEAEARRRGWIVVSPVSPDGKLFFEGPAELLPSLLDVIADAYPPEGGRFYLAGVSNGGLSAFRVALDSPDRFASLLAVPGFPPEPADFDHLDRIAGIPVWLIAGENDPTWREQMVRTADTLEALGGDVKLTISPGDGHIVQSLGGVEFFDFLDGARATSSTAG